MPTTPTRRRVVRAGLVLAIGLTSTLGLGAAPASAGVVDQCAGSEARQFVCLSYASFFRRTPSPAEVDYWAPSMPAKKTFFLATLGRSPESRRRMIEGYYFTFADTEADDAGVAYWEGEVLKPNGFRRLEAGLLGSYVGTIDGYLAVAFDTLLGREPTQGEADYWGTRVAQTSRTLVAADLAYTLEARRIRVRWTFLNELGYFPDATSRDYWAERLRTGTSFLELRIALKAAPDGYPEGTGYCSPIAPYLSNGCV